MNHTHLPIHWRHRLAPLALCAALCLPGAAAAAAAEPDPEAALASVKFVHSFEGPEGAEPTSALVFGGDGKIHGVTGFGGDADGGGTGFRMLPNGQLTVLHLFNKKRSARRPWGLIQGADGQYYGASGGGGEFHDSGTVYRMTPQGAVTVLHSFDYSAPEGAYPYAPLLQASDGSLYGTTCCASGKWEGGLFKVSTDGAAFKVVHQFSRTRGNVYVPDMMSLLQASDGNIYGVTQKGGAHDAGAIYRVAPDDTFEVFHSFRTDDHRGWGPATGLIEAPDGYLYGATYGGGAHGLGTFFRMGFDGRMTVLHAFHDQESNPVPNLLLARDGNFYGVTLYGGRYGKGSVFRLTPDGAFTQLFSFGEPDTTEGAWPTAGLVEAEDGVFYGTTRQGGEFGRGTIYRLRLK
ncbi:choice-of-anchor tandem repeat GloVer-containing protein [Ideonella sp.]|uniref:choice-of-anchor tandem repeat GloVer-containing protein n=1 Tax=Ideonella sp. TaxID=1929293 RepID=UPI0035ADFE0B